MLRKRALDWLSWGYASLIIVWLLLHGWYGDHLWWLALLNAFAPQFFAPLLLFLPLGLIFRRRQFWLPLLLVGLIFCWLYGRLFLLKSSEQTALNTPTFTVMTFNLWGGSHLTETAQVILENGTPDVVLLQELTPRMAAVLTGELGGDYPYTDLQTDPQNTGMGILSRFPIKRLDVGKLTNPAWDVQIFQVEMAGQSLIIYNCHPHSSNLLVYLQSGADVAQNVQQGFATRRQFAKQLLADLATRHVPVIVAGDFNSTEQGDLYTLLRQHLADAHRTAGWGFGHTFPAYRGSFQGVPILARLMRIDMIFYTAPLVALESRVSATYGESDHLPVIARLGWE